MTNIYTLANEIFFEATEIVEPKAREQFLDQRCYDNVDLRAQVESLLAAHAPAAEFFAQHGDAIASQEVNSDSLAGWKEGAVIERYQLLQKLGEGGFGIVFAAKQEVPVRRIVALKLIKPGMDTRDVVARFEAERQALAMMDHPHIARVLDAGATQTGHPFFVMELVKGSPITEYCDKRNLTTEQRLKLFQHVCDAVQHAHQKGVVHRDLKPSNIIVADDSGTPVPKVIDFGVAKAISQELTEKTLFTRFGQIIGTPEYMSPEQADTDSTDIDTRSDIYSLGIVLYELLTGDTPLDGERLRSAGWNEMVRLIREEKTVRPSDRISTSRDHLAIAARRGIQPLSLRKKLRRDLDWITLKAIEKDRRRRYESVGSFAEDIDRYLENQPVAARAPSTAYIAMKFVRRNRAAVIVATTLLTTILGGFAGTTFAWLRTGEARLEERQQRKTATFERDRANATSKQLTHTLYKSLLDRAQAECLNGRFDYARELLEKCATSERGWEWNHLWLRSRNREVVNLPGTGTPSLTPDGQQVYGFGTKPTENGSQAFRAWDPTTGDEKVLFETEGSVMFSSALSPDGETFLMGQPGSNVLRAYDTTTWSRLWELDAHPQQQSRASSRVTDIRFSQAGDRIATLQGSETIRVFDVASRSLLCRCKVGYHASNIAFSPDGNSVSASGKTWSVETGELVYDLHLGKVWLNSCFNADGSVLAIAGFGGRISLWNASNGKPIRSFEGHESWMSSIRFHPNSRLLLTGGSDTTIRVWDTNLGSHLWTIGNHRSVLTDLQISADGEKLMTTGMIDDTLSSWNVFNADMLTLHGHTDGLTGVAFLQGNKQIATVSVDGTVKVWDRQSGQLMRTIIVDEDYVQGLAMHPQESIAATIGYESPDIEIWDLMTGKRSRRLTGHTEPVFDVKFTPNGRFLLSAGLDGNLNVWSISTGMIVRTMAPVSGFLSEMAISSDSRYVAAQSQVEIEGKTRSGVAAWNIETGERHRTVTSGTTMAMEFIDVESATAPLQLAVGKMSSTLRFSNAHTGDKVQEVRGRNNWFFDFAHHADSNRFWSASLDGDLTVWDLEAREEIASIKAHTEPFWMTVSSDGKTIATAGTDGTAKLFESEPVSADVVALRAEVLEATMEVDTRFLEHVFFADVRRSFTTRPIDNPRINGRAIDIAEARGDNAVELTRSCREIVDIPTSTDSEFQFALRQAVAAVAAAPELISCRTALAVAQFRVGDYSSSIQSLGVADDLYEAEKATRGPIQSKRKLAKERLLRMVLRAMVLFESGDHENARAEFTGFESQCDEESESDTSIRAYRLEASALLLGE